MKQEEQFCMQNAGEISTTGEGKKGFLTFLLNTAVWKMWIWFSASHQTTPARIYEWRYRDRKQLSAADGKRINEQRVSLLECLPCESRRLRQRQLFCSVLCSHCLRKIDPIYYTPRHTKTSATIRGSKNSLMSIKKSQTRNPSYKLN